MGRLWILGAPRQRPLRRPAPHPAPAAPPAAPTPPTPPPTSPPAGRETPPIVDAPPVADPVSKAPKTAADVPAAPEPKAPTPATWPDNWRELMAGDDKKELARLQRMNSPVDVKNSWRAIEQRLSSGELKRALPTNHTEAELADYRKSNGIPDKPEDYDVNLGNGFVWGEADKPLLSEFTKFAHERNIPGDYVKSSLEWFAAKEQQMVEEIAHNDARNAALGAEALRAEWGNAFKGNLNAVRNMYEGQTVETADGKGTIPAFNLLTEARAPDGRRLGDIPGLLKIMSNQSREINPFATLVPEGNSTPIQSAETRLSELNGMMRDKSGPYWRGPQSDKLQAEWRDLYDATQKAKNRAA